MLTLFPPLLARSADPTPDRTKNRSQSRRTEFWKFWNVAFGAKRWQLEITLNQLSVAPRKFNGPWSSVHYTPFHTSFANWKSIKFFFRFHFTLGLLSKHKRFLASFSHFMGQLKENHVRALQNPIRLSSDVVHLCWHSHKKCTTVIELTGSVSCKRNVAQMLNNANAFVVHQFFHQFLCALITSAYPFYGKILENSIFQFCNFFNGRWMGEVPIVAIDLNGSRVDRWTKVPLLLWQS